MKPSSYPPEKMQRILALTGLVIVAATLRYRFVVAMDVSEFDPWRHLTLIDNIRRGAGFTLFAGQPYIWYNGIWYHLAALIGTASSAAGLSASLSLVSLAVFVLFLLRTEQSFVTALTGGLLMAAYGPVITFTSSYGAESFALLLVFLACLLATCQPNRIAIITAGILFGIALLSRINFLFNALLILPLLRSRTSRLIFLISAGAVVMTGWWHNHAAITAYPYLLTWDGMATRSADYNFISTLVPQMHPAVAHATHTLYEQVAPLPFDLFSRGRVAWGNIAVMVIGTCCVLATKRRWLIAATLVPLLYFSLGDKTLSTSFFRHYLALFPPMFIGIAVLCGRLRSSSSQRLALISWALPPVLVIVCGFAYLCPQSMPTLEMVTPPPENMIRDHYMVNSGFYHPESLIKRYPHKKFIGMPFDPDQFEDFARHYPQFTTILWHPQFSIQEPLFRYLTESGRYRVVGSFSSRAGFPYLLLGKN